MKLLLVVAVAMILQTNAFAKCVVTRDHTVEAGGTTTRVMSQNSFLNELWSDPNNRRPNIVDFGDGSKITFFIETADPTINRLYQRTEKITIEGQKPEVCYSKQLLRDDVMYVGVATTCRPDANTTLDVSCYF